MKRSKEKKGKKNKRLDPGYSIGAYIITIIILVVFLLYVNVTVGSILLFFVLLTPIISILLTLPHLKTLLINVEVEEGLLSKGESAKAYIKIANRFMLPTPPVTVVLTNDPRAKSEDEKYILSVLPRMSEEFEAHFLGRICGGANIGVKEIRISDYMGLVSFRYKLPMECVGQVSVIPEIAEVDAKEDAITNALQASLYNNDSEDTVEAVINTFGGYPGYESREYIPGDPLKRINWKQSAKRDKLLVRLDDEVTTQSISVVLDSVFFSDKINPEDYEFCEMYSSCSREEIVPSIAQDAVENALGIMQVFIRKKYSLTFYVFEENDFVAYRVEDEEDLQDVRLSLARYTFSQNSNRVRFPKEKLVEDGNTVAVFSTPILDSAVQGALEGCVNGSDGVVATYYSAEEQAKKNMVSVRRERKTEKKKFSFNNKLLDRAYSLRKYATGWLLSVALGTGTMALYDVSIWSLWTILCMLVATGIFVVCNYAEKHKYKGKLLIIAVSAICLWIYIAISQSTGNSFQQWFMSGGFLVENTGVYLAALLVIFPTFLAAVTYYFTQCKYRMAYLMLVCIIPPLLGVKVDKEMPAGYIVAIAVLNVAVYMIRRRNYTDREKKYIKPYTTVVSLGIFGALLMASVLAMPRSSETKYYSKFEETFMGGSVNVVVGEDYSEISENSGNADSFKAYNTRRLYLVYQQRADVQLHFRRQVFDRYVPENDYWLGIDKYNEETYTLEEWKKKSNYMQSLNLVKVLNKVEERLPGFLKTYNMGVINGANIYEGKIVMSVKAENFPAKALITNAGFVGMTIYGNTEDVYVNTHGIVNTKEKTDANITYLVESVNRFNDGLLWLDTDIVNFTLEESLVMLEHAYAYLGETSSYADVLEEFIGQTKEAIEYRDLTVDNYAPEKVVALAKEITKDCTYDWEKAKALEQYFEKNNFTYDLNYKAPDTSVEYFLFESKTGTCSDFATAYVIMARAVGLTVRYVEGYVANASNYSGVYAIRGMDAHAYPEVFIANVGYVVYDPTVSSNNSVAQGGMVLGIWAYMAVRVFFAIAIVAILLLVAFVVVVIITPLAKEKVFLGRVKKDDASRAVIRVYTRIQTRFLSKDIKNPKTLTPYEVAVAIEEQLGLDISGFAYLVEGVSYGEVAATEKDRAMAINTFNEVKKKLEEYKKQQRRKKHEKRSRHK